MPCGCVVCYFLNIAIECFFSVNKVDYYRVIVKMESYEIVSAMGVLQPERE